MFRRWWKLISDMSYDLDLCFTLAFGASLHLLKLFPHVSWVSILPWFLVSFAINEDKYYRSSMNTLFQTKLSNYSLQNKKISCRLLILVSSFKVQFR